MVLLFLVLCVLSGIVHRIASWGYAWRTREGVWQRAPTPTHEPYWFRFWMVTDDMPAANWLRCAGVASCLFLVSFVGLMVALMFR